jgi:AcrR family transcriptional regulator
VIADDGTEVPAARIADAAGVSRSTLYRHFSSREALVVAVVSQGWSTIADIAASSSRDGEAVRGVGRVLRASAVYLASHRAFLDIVELRDGREILGGEDVVSRAQHGFAELWRQAGARRQLRDGVQPCDVVALLAGVRDPDNAIRHAALVQAAITTW